MFEIDKEKFGAFLVQLRKEKGLTQKELAERLFVSDKAVSKWERALSLPDITLLTPLAEILGVTVTELLAGQRIAQEQEMPRQQVESLVQRAITLSEQEHEKNKIQLKWLPPLAVCALLSALELLLLLHLGRLNNTVVLLELLLAVFGCYFCLFVPEKLPAYYDENRISTYAHGPFRMNMVGISFRNSNWPYIINFCRCWLLVALLLAPLLTLAESWLLANIGSGASALRSMVRCIEVLLLLGTLFVPLYRLAKKYESAK